MQAICGFFRLDGAAAGAEDLARLRAALVYRPQHHAGRFDGWRDGCVAFGAAAWGGISSGGDAPVIAR